MAWISMIPRPEASATAEPVIPEKMIDATILAEVAEVPTVISGDIDIVPLDFIWGQITALTWLQAVFAVSFGVVYMLYGWRIFKILVIISFGLLGLFAGMRIGVYTGSQLWSGVTGLVVLAILSVPLMRWCVCILGAVAGGVITSGLWYAFELPQMYIWAGAIIGIVAGGMISFIVFKAAVMLFTSLGGSVITVVGLLALLCLYETTIEPPTEYVHNFIFEHNWFLPVVLLLPTLIGVVTQNKLIKNSSDWEM